MKVKALTVKVLLIFTAVAIVGCATMGGLKKAPLNEGQSQTYTSEFKTVLKAAQSAAAESGLRIEETYQPDGDTWAMIGKTGMSTNAIGTSYGTLVRVVVKKISENQTKVTVLTKKKSAMDIQAKGDYSKSILGNITIKLQ
jgi:hypothetical protein